MKILTCLLLIKLLAVPLAADAAESRSWTSTAGTQVTGTALQVKAGKVRIELDGGKMITVDLAKLSEKDQAYIAEKFGDAAGNAVPPAGKSGEAQGSGAPFVTDGLAVKVGETVGPIDAGGGATYFVYVPKSLRQGRKAALLHYNGAGGGNAKRLDDYIEGAEMNGWIVAASVQSKNGPGHPVKNHECAKSDVEHLLETLPVDEGRVYFTGGSGGGAMSFYNAARIKSAGAMPHIGYIPEETEIKKGDFFVINGTTDYNRYHSASAVESIGKSAVHRFHVGGHKVGPAWLCAEGIAWLNGRYLSRNSGNRDLAPERLDYEAAMIGWIKGMREGEPHRAYYWCVFLADDYKNWCVFLADDYKISGPNAAVLAPITAELAGDPACVRYVDGIEAISDFSEKNYSSIPGGSLFKHTTPKITSAAERLAEKYAGTPMIGDIAIELGKPTVGK